MKTLKNFQASGGSHCITNALKQIFVYYGHPMTEAMLFGLGSGLSFLYINQQSSPMISGRIRVFDFEKKLAERLQITLRCRTDKDAKRAEQQAKKILDHGEPVLIYADMSYLPYLGMDETMHFGGHAVVLAGYDDTAQIFLVSDRDHHDHAIRCPSGFIANDFHEVSYADMKAARSSRYQPFPANNKYLVMDFHEFREVNAAMLKEAILETCQTMLYPPAKLLGLQGILKFAAEIRKWKRFDEDKLCRAGRTNYFQIHEDGGTGGGIFRNLYGEFLMEAAPVMNCDVLYQLGQQFQLTAACWDELAKDLWQLSETGLADNLEEMSAHIQHLYATEQDLFLKLHKTVMDI